MDVGSTSKKFCHLYHPPKSSLAFNAQPSKQPKKHPKNNTQNRPSTKIFVTVLCFSLSDRAATNLLRYSIHARLMSANPTPPIPPRSSARGPNPRSGGPWHKSSSGSPRGPSARSSSSLRGKSRSELRRSGGNPSPGTPGPTASGGVAGVEMTTKPKGREVGADEEQGALTTGVDRIRCTGENLVCEYATSL